MVTASLIWLLRMRAKGIRCGSARRSGVVVLIGLLGFVATMGGSATTDGKLMKNLDLVLAYGSALGGSALLAYVSSACTDAGCIFGLILVVGLLLIAVVAALVAMKRRMHSAEWLIRFSPVPALGIVGVCVAVIASSVGPV